MYVLIKDELIFVEYARMRKIDKEDEYTLEVLNGRKIFLEFQNRWGKLEHELTQMVTGTISSIPHEITVPQWLFTELRERIFTAQTILDEFQNCSAEDRLKMKNTYFKIYYEKLLSEMKMKKSVDMYEIKLNDNHLIYLKKFDGPREFHELLKAIEDGKHLYEITVELLGNFRKG